MTGALEQRLLYFPDPQLYATPAIYNLPFDDVTLTTSDNIQLHGWFISGETGKPVVLFFHGNAGNISHRIDNLRLISEMGLSVLIFDYRGYGRSAGSPSESGFSKDALAALNWLKGQGWESDQIIYFGRSLGAAVAVTLADKQEPAKLILETPFTSVQAMGRHHYPLLNMTLGWLLRDRFDNLEKIGRVDVPLLIFQGDRDSIVPESMARELFAAANEPKTFHLIQGADHNDTYERGGEEYWEEWRRFVFQN